MLDEQLANKNATGVKWTNFLVRGCKKGHMYNVNNFEF